MTNGTLYTSAQQQNSLAATLGGFGQGLQQRQMNSYPALQGFIPAPENFFRRNSEQEAPVLSFFDKLRNEIDEWLKL